MKMKKMSGKDKWKRDKLISDQGYNLMIKIDEAESGFFLHTRRIKDLLSVIHFYT